MKMKMEIEMENGNGNERRGGGGQGSVTCEANPHAALFQLVKLVLHRPEMAACALQSIRRSDIVLVLIRFWRDSGITSTPIPHPSPM